MTDIDSAAFEAGVAPCNFTAGRIDSADESDAAHFSDALGRIYITAQALLLSPRPQAGHTQPALTLVVEDSANGSSWSTVATFDFTASDQQSAAVDSPRAYLRASWAGVVGVWAVDVAVKSIATPASGGGSLPAGGTAGQALLKVSSADGDAAWSGGLVFQVLGPYAIAFSDPDIFGDGIIVGDALPEGSTVLDMFMIVGTPWDAGGPTPSAAIGLSKDTSPPTVWSIRSVTNMQSAADGEPGSFVISHAHAPADLVPRPTLITGADARIALFVDTVCTAGTGDVYVILAAPPA